MFYIKTENLSERSALLEYLKINDILAAFHYVPLHSSLAGLKYGRFSGEDKYTTKESERLVRLPMYYGLEAEKIEYIVSKIKDFYTKR
jgi:dTDP-4-amino-4,6-dideoxygalactose transaminase